jgi:molybdopterin-synthase adenylyltransferase
MNDEALLRYSKHIMLPGIDYDGQSTLLNSTVLIVGLGGLGCAASQYLAASGVGKLILVDHDKIELSNLARQILYSSNQLGNFKVEMAAQQLTAINPTIEILCYPNTIEQLTLDWSTIDIIVDATDNFKTRFWLNAQAYAQKIPLVMGACMGYTGHLGVFQGYLADSPCYQCVYPINTNETNQTCAQQGVISPLPGIIGAAQAAETIKLLTGHGKVLRSQLWIIDLFQSQYRTVNVHKEPHCAVCQHD